MKSYFSNTWKTTLSYAHSSWTWYSHLPLWQQAALAAGTIIVVGGSLYMVVHGKGDVSSSSSSSGGENLFLSKNLDVVSKNLQSDHLQKTEDIRARITQILGEYIDSPERVEDYVNAFTPDLINFEPDRISIGILEALGRGKIIPSGISIENVFPQMFQWSQCTRPASVLASDLCNFGIHLVQKFFGLSGHLEAVPQSWVYLENLCIKPLHLFMQNPSLATNLDITRLKGVCSAVDITLSNPLYLSHVIGQDGLIYSWSLYYPYIINIPLAVLN